MSTISIYKNILLFLFLIGLSPFAALSSQNGLETIIVEKYYVSDANDTAASHVSGHLPVGSVTYRIYLDLLPGYRFYAAYGMPGHELKIQTTTSFFNNEHIGNQVPNVIPRHSLKRNTVMLDSWLSAGAAGEDYFGILKEQDDSLETIAHEGNFLQANHKSAGIPIKNRDGLVSGNVPRPAFFGIDSAAMVFFNKTKGSVFATRNGAWGCLGGAVGADSLTTNRVLIAQLTTDGELSFELNLQIGKANDIPTHYVARNAVDQEMTLPCLIYNSRAGKLTASKNNKPATKKNKP